MGITSKPLHLQIHHSLYHAQQAQWDAMTAQGHTIEVLEGDGPDIYLAPYAMRMTTDILVQLPTALYLMIKGARALRHSPHSKDTEGWKKGKTHAKGTKARTRQDATKQVTSTSGTEPLVKTEDTGTGDTISG